MVSQRAAFFSVILLNVLVQFVLGMRIAAAADETAVASPADPLGILFGGGKPAAASKMAREYDREQLKSMRTSYQLGCLFNLFLHFKMKMTQPMVYASVSGLVDLFFHPLVQIHLLGQPATGALRRPFGGGGGGLASLFNASAAAATPQRGAAGEGGADGLLGGAPPALSK